MSEGVASGCLGLPLSLKITSLLWFLCTIPMINLKLSFAACIVRQWGCRRYVGVSEAVGVSYGFLGLPLMLYITSFFCGLRVWSP